MRFLTRVFHLQPEQLQTLLKRIARLPDGLLAKGFVQVIEKENEQRVRILLRGGRVAVGLFPEDLLDAEGVQPVIADGERPVAHGVEPPRAGFVRCLKMQPVVHVDSVRVAVAVGSMRGQDHRLRRGYGKVFRANLKFSRAADDQYHMIREPVRSRQEKSARMPRITASLDCPNHALAPFLFPFFRWNPLSSPSVGDPSLFVKKSPAVRLLPVCRRGEKKDAENRKRIGFVNWFV